MDINHARERFRQSVVMLIAVLALHAWGSQDVAISLYNRLESHSSDRLMQLGEQYRNVTRQPDSALVCFSIVANRYYQGRRAAADIEHAIEAMTHVAYLYMEDFYDFPKAVSYNLRARELAELHDCRGYMPFILINEASIQSQQFSVEHPSDFNDEGMLLMKKAFYSALEQKNWYALHVSFMNLILHSAFYNKEGLIEKEMDIIKSTQAPDSTTHFEFARCLIDAVRAWNNHQPDSAGVFFEGLPDIARQLKNPRQRALNQIVANDYLAYYYEATGQNDRAIASLKDNERIATGMNLRVHLFDAYINQMRFYQHIKHDSVMAGHYRLLYLETAVSLLNDKKLGSASEAKFLYDLDKLNQQVREVAYREQMKSRMLWWAIAFLVLLVVLLGLLWFNYRRVQERNRQLYQRSLEMLRADEEKRELIERLQRVPDADADADADAESSYAPAGNPKRGGKLSEARQSDLMHRVFLVMETSDEIYSPEFSLTRLSELVGDTRNNVSEAINLRYRGNFNALLNEYRIKEACRRFNDRAHYGQLTIEGIGQSVGFKSRSAFSTVFKQIVGLTPGAYQRQSN